jgi:hypothetical protein
MAAGRRRLAAPQAMTFTARGWGVPATRVWRRSEYAVNLIQLATPSSYALTYTNLLISSWLLTKQTQISRDYSMLDKAKAWIVEDPSKRAWTTSALTILTSVFITITLRQISKENEIAWHMLYRTCYFYLLCIVYVVYASIQSAALKYDKKVTKTITKSNPQKYVESECLETYATTCKELLAQGKITEYHAAVAQLPKRGKAR